MTETQKIPAHCPHCHRLTIDEWVRRLNAKARKMDEYENMIHPSAWHEALQGDREDYTKLAQEPTCECEEKTHD